MAACLLTSPASQGWLYCLSCLRWHTVHAVNPVEYERLVEGNRRYETLRRLSPREYAALWREALEGRKPFDELVDEKA